MHDLEEYSLANMRVLTKDTVEVVCQGCRNTFIFQRHQTVSTCPFCGAPVSELGYAPPIFVPDEILPAVIISKVEVERRVREWLKYNVGSSLSPNIRDISGVYIPVWNFAVDSDTSYVARRGWHIWGTIKRQVLRSKQVPNPAFREHSSGAGEWTGSGEHRTMTVDYYETVTEPVITGTRWEENVVTGRVRRHDDIVVGTSQFSKGLDVYNRGALLPFDAAQLGTFVMCRSEFPEAHEKARAEVSANIRTAVNHDIAGCDVISIEGIETQYSDWVFRQVLVPIWFVGYTVENSRLYQDGIYRVCMNAYNGAMKGATPNWHMSKGCVVAIISAIVFFLLLVIVNVCVGLLR